MTSDNGDRRAKLRSAAQAELGGGKRRHAENEEVALRRETHAATMAKVARLKELRLAHEAAVESARAEAEKIAGKPPGKRRRAGG